MTLTIDLPPELTRQLEQEASERGLDVADYAARLLLDRTLAEHLRTVLAEMQGPPYEGLRDHLQRPELRPLAEALEG